MSVEGGRSSGESTESQSCSQFLMVRTLGLNQETTENENEATSRCLEAGKEAP